MNKIVIKTVLPCLAAFMAVSCIDHDYDLSGDIDFTIQVGGSDFAIPGGSTEAIPLSKILKIEDSDLVKIDNTTGDYYLSKSGTPASAQINVGNFSFPNPEIDPVDKELSFLPETSQAEHKPAGNLIKFEAQLPDDEYRSKFTLNSINVPEEIESLSKIEADVLLEIDVRFTTGVAEYLYIDDISIDMPDCLIMGEQLLPGNVKRISGVKIANNGTYNLVMPIKGIYCEPEHFDGKTNTLNISGEICFSGSLHLLSDELLIAQTNNPKLNLMSTITIKDAHSTDGNIRISSINGVVNPDIDFNIDPVEITGLPDFLKDDEVVLDIANPMIFFNVSNLMPVKALAGGEFRSSFNNGAAPVFAHFDGVAVPANSHTVFCMSPQLPDVAGTTHISVPDLPALFEKIPDYISVDINARAAQESVELRLGRNYDIKADYEVKVPFAFGRKLKIVYNDTIGDWSSDLEKYEIRKLNAFAQVVNDLPLDVVIEAVAVGDSNRRGERPVIDGISVKVEVPSNQGNVIKAGSTCDIVVRMEETIAGSVKKLDGLVMHIVATASAETPADKMYLNKNQTIQFKNVKLKVPGGAIVDLN